MSNVIETIEKDAVKVWNVMKHIGANAEKDLAAIEPYLPKALHLVQIFFPQIAAPAAGIVNAIELIQNGIVIVEQKMAALGQSAGTGAQKAATVLQLVETTALSELQAAGVHADSTFLQNVINGIVDILKIRTVTVTGSVTGSTTVPADQTGSDTAAKAFGVA